jgi:hypothetical protein
VDDSEAVDSDWISSSNLKGPGRGLTGPDGIRVVTTTNHLQIQLALAANLNLKRFNVASPSPGPGARHWQAVTVTPSQARDSDSLVQVIFLVTGFDRNSSVRFCIIRFGPSQSVAAGNVTQGSFSRTIVMADKGIHDSPLSKRARSGEERYSVIRIFFACFIPALF